MSNTSSEMVSKVSLLSASASSYHNLCMVASCFSCLVSMTPGWRTTTLWAKSRKYNITRSGINLENRKWANGNTVNRVLSPMQHHKALLSFSPYARVLSCSTICFHWPHWTALFPGNGPCEQHCTPVGARPHCSCSPGFTLRADGRSCEGKELKPGYHAGKKI